MTKKVDPPKWMSAETIENIVFEFELIRIVIRAPADQRFNPYCFQRKAPAYMEVDSWIFSRLRPILGDFRVAVIDGCGRFPHWRTPLKTLRDSYKR